MKNYRKLIFLIVLILLFSLIVGLMAWNNRNSSEWTDEKMAEIIKNDPELKAVFPAKDVFDTKRRYDFNVEADRKAFAQSLDQPSKYLSSFDSYIKKIQN